MRRVVASLVLVLAMLLLVQVAAAQQEVFEQTYPLPAGGSFLLSNVNGSVEVHGWERNGVEVRAVKTTRSDPADLRRVQIDVAAGPDSVSVETRYPEDEGVDVQVEYRIRVPRRVALRQIATVNGAIRVWDVEATGDLRAINGDIEAFDCYGRFSAHTTNGNVRLELRHLDDGPPVTVETVNGSVLLALPPNTSATLDVNSMNGDFRSELPITLRSSMRRQAFVGRLGGGGSSVQIRTVNGGIRVVTLRPIV